MKNKMSILVKIIIAMSLITDLFADEYKIHAKDNIKEALSCWARGMDLTIGGKGLEGKAEWDRCYADPRYQFEVFFRGQVITGSSTVDRMNTNVQTAGGFGFKASQHYVSNFEIVFEDEKTAIAKALQKADHFKDDLTVESTWGVLKVKFEKNEFGKWRAIKEVMDIQRFIGFSGQFAPSNKP